MFHVKSGGGVKIVPVARIVRAAVLRKFLKFTYFVKRIA